MLVLLPWNILGLFAFQAAKSAAVNSCQIAKRSAISVRHSGAEGLCRLDRKCCEMPLNADRNRCACPADVKRLIALGMSSRLMGVLGPVVQYLDRQCSTEAGARGGRLGSWRTCR